MPDDYIASGDFVNGSDAELSPTPPAGDAQHPDTLVSGKPPTSGD